MAGGVDTAWMWASAGAHGAVFSIVCVVVRVGILAPFAFVWGGAERGARSVCLDHARARSSPCVGHPSGAHRAFDRVTMPVTTCAWVGQRVPWPDFPRGLSRRPQVASRGMGAAERAAVKSWKT